MTQFEQEQAAKKFVELWKNKGSERSEAQKFWIQLLRDVLGVNNSEQYIDFELPIKLAKTSFADGYIEDTHTLIEMKSKDIDLEKKEKQSDGSMLTPYQQAKRYSDNLGYTKRARWIVVSNFRQIDIYDMEKPHSKPQRIELENLPKDIYILDVLVNSEDENIKREEDLSVDAGKIVGKLYKELEKEYLKRESDETKFATSINALCVRLVFCLYAEDSGLFGKHMMFHDYLKKYPASEIRNALIKLFKILDTPEKQRDKFESEELLAFPYVNGGLFADEDIIIPQITDEIKNILLVDASEEFNWSNISPTIFGAVFESTLNPITRREGGMHYTSVKNIHKLIDALFLDKLTYELDKIISNPVVNERKKQLLKYQEKLASLKFLDPACGSGNFLTETYLSLRHLENRMLESYYEGQSQFATTDTSPIKVSINQFYGIEINDFAVTVAKTALWIAEDQMYKKTKEIVMINEAFLPLKSYTQITEGNALRIDWNEIVSKEELNYIMGNPPFVGARKMSQAQKDDLFYVFGNIKKIGNIDYVSGWYKISTEYMKGTNIKAAFVSTNSITQGEQVAILWKNLFESNIVINYAYRTFVWDSESNSKAHVHCVIIGFSYINNENKFIYNDNKKVKAKNINGYLIDAPNIFIESRNKTLCNVSKMNFGSMPNDNGYLSNYSKEQKEDICKKYPEAEQFFKTIMGAEEFINRKERYCLWLKDVEPNRYSRIKPIVDAINRVRKNRENSKRYATKKLADTPYLFGEIRQPESNYLLIPSTSSEKRNYIPIGFFNKDVIATNANLIIPNATLYEFGIITSNVHMGWMRTVCGRLEMRYRYSAEIVYNNFPWPSPTEEQRKVIERTAKEILDIRAKHSNSSLAELYNKNMMPIDLIKAHKNNDAAVMNAYGFNWRKMSEADCVAELMKMYQKMVEK